MRVRIMSLAVVIALAISSTAAAAWAGAAGSTTKPKPELRDNALRDEIAARFARSKSSADHFQVHVQGKTATLTGKTDVVQHKASATRMAKSAGATQVINNIQVSAAAKTKASEGLRRAAVHRSETTPRSERSEKR